MGFSPGARFAHANRLSPQPPGVLSQKSIQSVMALCKGAALGRAVTAAKSAAALAAEPMAQEHSVYDFSGAGSNLVCYREQQEATLFNGKNLLFARLP
jgi:hypothetical protein